LKILTNINSSNIFIIILFISFSNLALSQETEDSYIDYKSIKKNNANMRLGPGKRYEIIWNFTKADLPVKIIKKFDLWYKVETPDGSIGWMKGSLLAKQKTIIFKKNDKIYKNNNLGSNIIAHVDKNSILKIHYCKNQWCKVESNKYRIIGFVQKNNIWGAFVSSSK